jgi:hypothetical protein
VGVDETGRFPRPRNFEEATKCRRISQIPNPLIARTGAHVRSRTSTCLRTGSLVAQAITYLCASNPNSGRITRRYGYPLPITPSHHRLHLHRNHLLFYPHSSIHYTWGCCQCRGCCTAYLTIRHLAHFLFLISFKTLLFLRPPP